MSLFGKKTKREDIYIVEAFCENCETRYDVEIEKGKKVEEFFKNHACEECGCNTVRKSALGPKYY